jgi:hypothetical protein
MTHATDAAGFAPRTLLVNLRENIGKITVSLTTVPVVIRLGRDPLATPRYISNVSKPVDNDALSEFRVTVGCVDQYDHGFID